MCSYPQPRSCADIRIAVICALPREYDAVILAFDEIWNDVGDRRNPALRQHNNHTLGRIGVHNVVLALLPNMGKVGAANEAARLRSIYEGLEIAFLTGVCGGVPKPGTDDEILLGDVVIGKSIVQYDFGRQYPGNFTRKDTIDDNLSRLNKDVRSFLAIYETLHGRNRLQHRATEILEQVQRFAVNSQIHRCYDRPAAVDDILFEPNYLHRHQDKSGCGCNEFRACNEAINASCEELRCDTRYRVSRKRLESEKPELRIHVGRFGSGDTVMKSGEHRDRDAAKQGIIAFEMEGAGVWEEIPCIIVKGVCDYADSHKNKSWQDFAAAIAASATKALIEQYVSTIAKTSYMSSVDSTSAMFTLAPVSSGVAGVNRFVGRGDELRRLHEALEWTGKRRTAVLHGLGGIGKTQLSIEYTRRHCNEYSAILWVNARDETSLKQSFQQAAQRIIRKHPSVAYIQNAMVNRDLDETAEAVRRWLDEAGNDRWLVVYDNYDDVRFDNCSNTEEIIRSVPRESLPDSNATTKPEAAGFKAYDIRSYFPETDHGAILITTRSSTVKLGHLIQLSKLRDVNESLAILESTSHRADLVQNPDANALVQRLDGLPLALSTAGAYLNQVSRTYAEYLRLYEQSWLRLQKESPQLLNYDRALYLTWEISFQHIQQQSQSAAMLLKLWAYFDNEDLWYELLCQGRSKGPAWLKEITEDELSFDAAMRLLCQHGLVEADPPAKETRQDSSGYSVHRCVHAWMEHVLNTGLDEEMAWTAMRCVASHVPSTDHHEFWLVQRRLLQHADRCIKIAATGAGEEEAWMFHKLGNLYSAQGRLKEAEAMYERSLQGKEKALGPDHTSTLDTVSNIGFLYLRQGRLKEAEAIYKRALQGKEKALGPDHTSTLDTVNNLGVLYRMQGRLKEAEATYERALRGSETALGPDHTSTLSTVNNLGILYRMQGRLKEAEATYERSLQGKETALGPDHTSTLSTVNNLGILYGMQGRLKEAEAMYERALQGFEKALGPNHTLTLKVATSTKSKVDSREANVMYERALQGYENVLGPDAMTTYVPALNTLRNFGSLLEDLDENDRAIANYQRAHSGILSVFGSQNERFIYTSGKIGALQLCAQEKDVSLSLKETAGRGSNASWRRQKGRLQRT
ncbi:Nephrocystin-3-like protein 2 [Colletotrichum chlorophyti]|uniref:Nephrocystin-3-like protein 2 n=1 Tax=Colletotrichum chlorophyti TaxID=708187 RepID=A0A1Q8S6E6_9PEZI|nr:Nephrocystin-3-like protein 2 [Colletotrichum chlorophyti]